MKALERDSTRRSGDSADGLYIVTGRQEERSRPPRPLVGQWVSQASLSRGASRSP